MKTFATLVTELSEAADTKDKLKTLKKGQSVTFDHYKHGKITGTYAGPGRMGGRTYAKVEHPEHGATWVPPHQIHEQVTGLDESVQLTESGNFRNIPHDAPADPRNHATTMVYKHTLNADKKGWTTHHEAPDGGKHQIGGVHKTATDAMDNARAHAKMHGKLAHSTLTDHRGGKDVDHAYDNNHEHITGKETSDGKHYDAKGHRKDSYWD